MSEAPNWASTWRINLSAGLLAICLAPTAAFADDATKTPWLPDNSLGTAIPILADPGGLRSALWAKGVKFQLTDIEEVLGNVRGGIKRGAIEDGQVSLAVDADLAKALGWQGASVHANVFGIHGPGLSRYYINNFITVSNVESVPTIRLYEAWFEQTFADGKVSLRLGQLGADTEFLLMDSASLFNVSTVGWPSLAAVDLPDGGPAYPFGVPAARLALHPNEQMAFLLGVYDGLPAGPGQGDPQKLNRYGLNFRVGDPPFVIGEAQFKYGGPKPEDALPGVVKIGAWSHFGHFADQRFGDGGLPLASPLSNGLALQHRGDQAIYGSIDQKIYRLGDAGDKGVSAFLRASAAPSDRNVIDLYVDGGLNFSGLWERRPDDAFGFAFGYARISDAARAADRDQVIFSGVPTPVRSYEAVFEATYSAQIMPGWTIQPDFQYVVHPMGGAPDPTDPTGLRPMRNAMVIGLRTLVKY